MEYGKFASAEELLRGYNELEKSFTQKCQQLAEIKAATLANTDGTNAAASPSEAVQSTTVDNAETVPSQVAPASDGGNGYAAASNVPSDQVLQQYLEANPQVAARLLQHTSTEFAPAVMSGGGNVTVALPSRPKTIKEASVMAKELFLQS